MMSLGTTKFNLPIAQLTEEQVKEVNKCREDIFYWIEKYVKIENPKAGLTTPILYPKFRKMLRYLQNEHHMIVLKSRQLGGSTCTALFLTHAAHFNTNWRGGLMSAKQKAANEFLDRVKRIHSRLPAWLRPTATEWSKTSVAFDNGSVLMTSAACRDPFRGETMHYVLIDEAGHIHGIEQYYASIYLTLSMNFSNNQTILKERKVPYGIVIIDTGNYLRYACAKWFYNIWVAASKKENQFFPLKIHWSEVPYLDADWYTRMSDSINPSKTETGKLDVRAELDCEFIEESEDSEIFDKDHLKQCAEGLEKIYINWDKYKAT